jgi:hypothetical protein
LKLCRLPVLAAIQGGCIGGGVDLVTACDMRYATRDAFVTIYETKIGMTADVGTFPRIVKLIPEGLVREMAYTGRRVSAEEARDMGLVNRVYDTHEDMLAGVMEIAREIAANAPLAVHGCKRAITYARDHSTQEGLEWIGMWNASMLQNDEIMEAMTARHESRPAEFVDLPTVRNKVRQRRVTITDRHCRFWEETSADHYFQHTGTSADLSSSVDPPAWPVWVARRRQSAEGYTQICHHRGPAHILLGFSHVFACGVCPEVEPECVYQAHAVHRADWLVFKLLRRRADRPACGWCARAPDRAGI